MKSCCSVQLDLLCLFIRLNCICMYLGQWDVSLDPTQQTVLTVHIMQSTISGSCSSTVMAAVVIAELNEACHASEIICDQSVISHLLQCHWKVDNYCPEKLLSTSIFVRNVPVITFHEHSRHKRRVMCVDKITQTYLTGFLLKNRCHHIHTENYNCIYFQIGLNFPRLNHTIHQIARYTSSIIEAKDGLA